MPAAGKTNASRVQINERIIVRVSEDGTVRPSDTKTGEGVHVARVTGKGAVQGGRTMTGRGSSRMHYSIETTSGTISAAPVQTFWLAPEDAAGVKRAHVEALAENKRMDREATPAEVEAPAQADALRTAAKQARTAPTAKRAAEIMAAAMGLPTEALAGWVAANWTAPVEALTLHSQDGKVDSNSTDDLEETEMSSNAMHEAKAKNEADKIRAAAAASKAEDARRMAATIVEIAAEGEQAETATPAEPENHTGSTVVKVLEKVWSRIRSNHPELPEVVIITGSGEGTKWGHFRAESWKVRAEEGAAVSTTGRRHELFLSSEALAKGSAQVLQTMVHEAAHTLSRVRGQQDTSRQGRWHNTAFKKAAEELGLEHKSSTADKTHGFAFVTLTRATRERYADLITELDAEIKLTGLLPSWLGGEDSEDERGGERIAGKPAKGDDETKGHSGSQKATCGCENPVIIRLSQKVLDMGVVRCDDCGDLFTRP